MFHRESMISCSCLNGSMCALCRGRRFHCCHSSCDKTHDTPSDIVQLTGTENRLHICTSFFSTDGPLFRAHKVPEILSTRASNCWKLTSTAAIHELIHLPVSHYALTNFSSYSSGFLVSHFSCLFFYSFFLTSFLSIFLHFFFIISFSFHLIHFVFLPLLALHCALSCIAAGLRRSPYLSVFNYYRSILITFTASRDTFAHTTIPLKRFSVQDPQTLESLLKFSCHC